MPGVPSGRGCDACRKQKKKCDGQQPSCARCKRLGLACLGSGQRRFKFVQIQEGNVVKKQRSSPEAKDVVKLFKPSPSPSNEATLLVGSFVTGLSVKDPRFDLSCYGAFLGEIPKRLGAHPALDASASALICTYPAVYNRKPSYEALAQYGRALRVLRTSISSPNKDQIVELLCAIYFVLICQNWIAKPGDEIICHGKAVAQVLNAVAGKFPIQQLGEGFEHQVLTSMCMVVILESIFDPTIRLHPWYRANLSIHSGPAKPQDGKVPFGPPTNGLPRNTITLDTLAGFPDLLQAPRANLLEIESLYFCACVDSEEVIARQATFADLASSSPDPSATALAQKMKPLLQVAQSLLLGICITCNAVLSVLDPSDFSLTADSARFCRDAVSLAREASSSRPLGASHIPLCLVAAYMAAEEEATRDELLELLVDYEGDFGNARWVEIGTKLRAVYIAARLKESGGVAVAVEESEVSGDVGICAVQ